MKRRKITYPPMDLKRASRRSAMWNLFITVGFWCVGFVLFYVITSLFDTPAEHRAKESTRVLKSEYAELTARLDTLNSVLESVKQRDENVFKMLFESEPYDLEKSEQDVISRRIASGQGQVDGMTMLVNNLESRMLKSYDNLERLYETMQSGEVEIDNIPSIQPVINKELTLLTASYGMRIHPFYKSLVSHQGVDFTVPEGARVFATADGKVKETVQRHASSGLSVTISHGNGYETTYAHLSKINVHRGQSVRRGDIIAYAGNTGLSLSPHLHYEVRYNGMRVDPINYFFAELSPEEYKQILKIAQSGMQSFD